MHGSELDPNQKLVRSGTAMIQRPEGLLTPPASQRGSCMPLALDRLAARPSRSRRAPLMASDPRGVHAGRPSMLDSDQPGDGAVFRACCEAQRMFFDPPDLSHATGQSSRRPGRQVIPLSSCQGIRRHDGMPEQGATDHDPNCSEVAAGLRSVVLRYSNVVGRHTFCKL